MTDLSDFCRRVCAIPDDPETFLYLRLRSGRLRKSAEVIASGIECTGELPMQLERILLERVSAAGGDDPVWIEAIARGSSQIRDTIKIHADADGEQGELAVQDTQGVISSLTDAIVTMTLRAEERADRATQSSMETTVAFVRTFQELAHAKAELEHADGGGSEVAQALTMLAPMLPVLMQKLTASPSQPSTMAPAEQAEHLLRALHDFQTDNPGILTPESLSRASGL